MRTLTPQSRDKIYVDRCCWSKHSCKRVERAIERKERQAAKRYTAHELSKYETS